MFWKRKKMLIEDKNIENLIDWTEPDGCIVSNKILFDGEKVGYMFRDEPESEVDSGWRIYSGTESEEYLEDYKKNVTYTNLNTVCNYDKSIIPIIKSSYRTAFRRNENNEFMEVPYE